MLSIISINISHTLFCHHQEVVNKFEPLDNESVGNALKKISPNFKSKHYFGITGTNGKTSVSDLFYQILRINNIRVASIGTLGIKYNDKLKSLTLLGSIFKRNKGQQRIVIDRNLGARSKIIGLKFLTKPLVTFPSAYFSLISSELEF